MVDEDVSFGLGISDCAAIMGHASLRELVSGIHLRPQMTFHIPGPSSSDIEQCRKSFQLFALASLIATLASQQVSILFCQF